MKKFISVFVLFALIFLCVMPVSADFTLPETIKIGLFYNNTAKSSCVISADSEIIVYYDSAEVGRGYNLNIRVDENLMIVVSENGNALLVADNNELKFEPTDGFISLNGTKYRGSLQLINLKNGKMTIINKVGIEEYLYSVLPREMATGWPMEALKAQAVCARTYAATNIGRFKKYGFDLTDDTLSQVYGGVKAEKDDCTQAVEETRGMIVTYEGSPASVFYYATSSGESLDVYDVWGSKYPYLVSVPDLYQDDVIPDKGAWTVNYTIEEITDKMNSLGYDLGTITDVTIDKTSPQGAVTMMTIKGTKSSSVFERERARNILSFRSQVFTVNSHRNGGETLYIIGANEKKDTVDVNVLGAKQQGKLSDMYVLGATGSKKVTFGGNVAGFTFNGTGYGHGIGMSQNGAKGMARAGFTYDQILTHYFQGTEVSNAQPVQIPVIEETVTEEVNAEGEEF